MAFIFVYMYMYTITLTARLAVLALLLPRRWPALRACSLADKDAYIFVYYGISPNLVGGGALGSGFDPTCW